MTSSGARAVAAKVLSRVWDERAFAAAALDAEIEHRAGLDPRDAGLATELVYGVLRAEPWLLAELEKLSHKNKILLEGAARAHLFIAAYTIVFLDKIPAFAAVSEAVDGIRAESNERSAGWANAILRRLAGEYETKRRPSARDVAIASEPGWLRGALRLSIGRAAVPEFLGAGPIPPPIGLALAPDEDRSAWIAKLVEAAPSATVEAGKVSPRAILVRGAGDVRRLPGAGASWIIQEEGAQAVALALGARPGDWVLDACAGRGNKGFLIGHALGRTGKLDAADLYPRKLEQLRVRGLDVVRATFAVDWSVGTGDVPIGYDRILVDAPCSGIGTLRRRPEIARIREEADIPRLADLQVAIASRAASRLKPGGRLVYAVCSVLKQECEDVVARIEGVEPAPFDDPLANELAAGGTGFRLLPHVHGTDGYFVASFTRSRADRS